MRGRLEQSLLWKGRIIPISSLSCGKLSVIETVSLIDCLELQLGRGSQAFVTAGYLLHLVPGPGYAGVCH